MNVLARAHYLPLFSRLGAYRRESLDRLSAIAPVRLFEYWGHEASLLPVELQPLLRWRMAEHHAWSGVAETATENPRRVAQVRQVLADHGPLNGQQLEAVLESGQARSRDRWGWNWSITKHIVEHLFWTGEVTAIGRDSSFRRRYDLAQRVLPPDVIHSPTPTREAAIRRLVERSARSLGVATISDLQDYFRLPAADTRIAVQELADDHTLLPVTVPGWQQAWLHADAAVPRRVAAQALLVPFDPLIWERRRVERAFGMRYRIEIYVPAAKREYGYYVLPFLLGEDLVARVDLKADRHSSTLLVQSAWVEADHDPDTVAGPLMSSLRELASWLGLAEVAVRNRGTLSPALAACCD